MKQEHELVLFLYKIGAPEWTKDYVTEPGHYLSYALWHASIYKKSLDNLLATTKGKERGTYYAHLFRYAEQIMCCQQMALTLYGRGVQPIHLEWTELDKKYGGLP